MTGILTGVPGALGIRLSASAIWVAGLDGFGPTPVVRLLCEQPAILALPLAGADGHRLKRSRSSLPADIR